MDEMLNDLAEEITEISDAGIVTKRKKFQFNQLVTNGYQLSSTANSTLKQTIVNPVQGNQKGGFKAIIVGVSLVNQTASADNSANAQFSLIVNNNRVLDSICGSLLDVSINRTKLWFPIMYEITTNSQISAELLATVSNGWHLDIFFRPVH